MKAPFLLFVVLGLALCSSVAGQTILRADGVTDTYTLIDSVLGGTGTVVEVPDCKHTDFGPHMTQVNDTELGRPVFAFHSHIRLDDDRCEKFDRQRVEIKTYDKSGDHLLGFYGDRMTLSWNFKLDAGFLPPYSFCHLHQIKARGGDDSMPVITLTARKSNPNELQLLQYDSVGSLLFLETQPLAPFLGEWLHGYSDLTYGHNGTYFFQLTRLRDGAPLFTYTSSNIDFWRNGTTFIRPKWGIYRSIQEAVLSRDEIVLFDDFCIGKGNLDRCN